MADFGHLVRDYFNMVSHFVVLGGFFGSLHVPVVIAIALISFLGKTTVAVEVVTCILTIGEGDSDFTLTCR